MGYSVRHCPSFYVWTDLFIMTPHAAIIYILCVLKLAMNTIRRNSFNQSDINSMKVTLVRLLHFLLGWLLHLINSPKSYLTLLKVVSPPVYLMGFFYLFSTTCLLFFTLSPLSPCVPEDVIRSVCSPRWEMAHVAAGMSMVTDLAQDSLAAKLLHRADWVTGKTRWTMRRKQS